jgi:hypothetical protein
MTIKIKEVIIMTEQMKKSLLLIGELGGILTLTGMTLNEITKRYDAERKLNNAELKLALTSLVCDGKDLKIKLLEKELDELKKENVEEEES